MVLAIVTIIVHVIKAEVVKQNVIVICQRKSDSSGISNRTSDIVVAKVKLDTRDESRSNSNIYGINSSTSSSNSSSKRSSSSSRRRRRSGSGSGSGSSSSGSSSK